MAALIGVFGCNGTKDAEKELFGKITGVGADVFEISAEFDSDNSGSPVLNLNQEIIGIASYARTSGNYAGKAGTRFEDKTRYFCYRLSDNHWQPVNWKRFNKEYGHVYQDNSIFIAGIFDMLSDWSDAPMERIDIRESQSKTLIVWAESHNELIDRRPSKKKRAFASEYSDSLTSLSEDCASRARQMRLLADQRGLTGFLRKEFEKMADRLERHAMDIDQYGDKLAARNFFYFK